MKGSWRRHVFGAPIDSNCSDEKKHRYRCRYCGWAARRCFLNLRTQRMQFDGKMSLQFAFKGQMVSPSSQNSTKNGSVVAAALFRLDSNEVLALPSVLSSKTFIFGCPPYLAVASLVTREPIHAEQSNNSKMRSTPQSENFWCPTGCPMRILWNWRW